MPRLSLPTAFARAFAASALIATCGASSADTLPPETIRGMVDFSATMNHLALACGDLSPSTVQSMQKEQRAAMLKDIGVAGADYDRAYAAAIADAEKNWARGSAADKKNACAQVKSMSAQPAAGAQRKP